MNSVALAAHTTAAAPAFNGLFYATAATIIPVLFLAIAVQGRTYENLVKTLRAPSPRWTWTFTGPWRQQLPAVIVALATMTIVVAILVFGAVSEILAVYALYQQQALARIGQGVLNAVIFLVIATAAGPALAFLRALFTHPKSNEPASSESSGKQEPGASQADEPGPEVGKTRTEAGN
jgi:hypothetical protein